MSLSNITRSQKVIKLVNEFLKAKVVSNPTQNVCLHPYDVDGNLEKDFVLLKLFDKSMFINNYYVHGIVFELDFNKNDFKLKLWGNDKKKVNRNKLFIRRQDIYAFDKEHSFDVGYYIIDSLLSSHYRSKAEKTVFYYANEHDFKIAKQSQSLAINLDFLENAIIFVESIDGNMQFIETDGQTCENHNFGVILFNSHSMELTFNDLDDLYLVTDKLSINEITKIVRKLDQDNNFDNSDISKKFKNIY